MIKKYIPLILVLSSTGTAMAKNLGIYGSLFDINEPNLLEVIQNRLKTLDADGTLEFHKQEIVKKMKERVLNPKPVAGVVKTVNPRTFYWDPTITIPRDLTDHEGKVFWAKGKKFNPLTVTKLSKDLLFVDGNDKEQEEWAIKRLQTTKAMIILVSGKPFDWMKRHNTTVYFDQEGRLVQKFKITQVPAIVTQEANRLKIEELILEETKK